MHLISMRRPSCVHLLGENPETRDNRESKETLPALVHIMFESPDDVTSIPKRRAHPRLRVDSLAPIDLGTGTTGTILNVSEGGLAARVPVTLDPALSGSSHTIPPANIGEWARSQRTNRVGE